MYKRAENTLWIGGLALLLAGCEIVQSNIPITFDDGTSASADAGDPGIPAYSGTACGAGSATLCTVSSPADAGAVDAGAPDAGALEAGALEAGALEAGALEAGALEAGLLDAAPLDADAPDAAPDAQLADAEASEAGAPDAGAEVSPAQWCALRCIKACGTGVWDCNGPLVCGVGEAPPSCGLMDPE